MSIFRKKVREFVPNTAGSDRESGFHYRLAPEGIFQQELYDALRANVPVIDACFGKIIRLTGVLRLRLVTRGRRWSLIGFAERFPWGCRESPFTHLRICIWTHCLHTARR
ncbi:hypothetical protein [Ruminococcus sp.]|uniref:hypothetical protein n=1 Tax=Ruminococcus sp. TaxID=41978 RepID=UPI002E78B444|nr:hypothetical protein [Ruminococcus sp.]MEE0502852.1 hypothetical protein [Ruminococcus sp.]